MCERRYFKHSFHTLKVGYNSQFNCTCHIAIRQFGGKIVWDNQSAFSGLYNHFSLHKNIEQQFCT